MYIYLSVYLHVYMCTYICIYIYIHFDIHTHTPPNRGPAPDRRTHAYLPLTRPGRCSSYWGSWHDVWHPPWVALPLSLSLVSGQAANLIEHPVFPGCRLNAASHEKPELQQQSVSHLNLTGHQAIRL